MPFSPEFRRQLAVELQVKYDIPFEMAFTVVEWFSGKSKDAASLKTNCTKVIEKVLAERPWVEALCREETGAWKKLYQNCYHETADLLRKKGALADDEGVSSGIECRDIFQLAAVDFWKKLQKHDFVLFTSVCSYVKKISLHHLYNALRARKKIPPTVSWETFIVDVKSSLDDSDIQENEALLPAAEWSAEDEHRLFPDTHQAGFSLEDLMMQCFGKIKNARYRDVLTFKYFENSSHEEVAKRLKISITNSKQLLMRAKSQIQKCLDNLNFSI